MKENLWYSKAIDNAIKLRNNNKLEDTALMYTKALELRPNDFLSQLYRGDVLLELQEYDKALADFKKCS